MAQWKQGKYSLHSVVGSVETQKRFIWKRAGTMEGRVNIQSATELVQCIHSKYLFGRELVHWR